MKAQMIGAMMKHLPPSASRMRILDLGGAAGMFLSTQREELVFESASLYVDHWTYEQDSQDAIVGYDLLLKADLLSAVLSALRPGGRFIVVQPLGTVEEFFVSTLESSGFTRILVEAALESGEGVLIRGEKPHTTEDTFVRVAQGAHRDPDSQNPAQFQGRYIYLLIQQTPNKPVWSLTPDDQIEWQAVVVHDEREKAQIIAFSSLPKAVQFMQPAVMQGLIVGVNKVGKFKKSVFESDEINWMINPMIDQIKNRPLSWVPVDVHVAEAPDE